MQLSFSAGLSDKIYLAIWAWHEAGQQRGTANASRSDSQPTAACTDLQALPSTYLFGYRCKHFLTHCLPRPFLWQ